MIARGSLEEFLHDIEPFFYGKSLTYVDVGAYVGKVFKKLVASGLRIREAHLIEPNPAALRALQEVVAERQHGTCAISVYELALGDAAGTVRLRSAESMTKVVATNPLEALPVGQSNFFDAQRRTLDELAVGFTEGHVSLLKIDAEGSEDQVLAGAAALLREQRVDVVYIEVGMNPEGTQQCYYRVVDDLLRASGYRLFRIYEQMHEWMDDSPLLRRANLAYMSERFAAQNPYRLCKELFEARQQLKQLQAELTTEKARADAGEAQLAALTIEQRTANQVLLERQERVEELTRQLVAREVEQQKQLEDSEKHAGRAAELADSLRQLAARQAEVEHRLALAGGERDELAARLDVALTEHERAVAALAHEQARLAQTTLERDELRAEHERAESERQLTNAQLASMQGQLEQLRDDRQRLVERIEDESRLLRQATAERLALVRQVEQTSARELAAVEQRDRVVAELAELDRERRQQLSRMELELRSAREQRDALRHGEHSLNDHTTMQAALAAAESKHAELKRQHDALMTRHAETEQMAREIHRLYDSLRTRERRARAEAALALDKAARIKQHLSYRLGAALIENSRSPMGWLKAPVALRQAYAGFVQQKGQRPAPAVEPAHERLTLGGPSFALPLSADWQQVNVSTGAGGELCAYPFSVIGGAIATIEMLVEEEGGTVQIHELAGDPLHPAVQQDAAGEVLPAARGLRLRAARSHVLFRCGGQGEVRIKLRKTRGEPCIVRLELRSSTGVLASPASARETPPPSKKPGGLSGSLLASLLIKTGPKKPARNVLFEAFKQIRAGQAEAALAFATANADAVERIGIHLLKAMIHESNEAAWLSHVNAYLQQFAIAPLDLAPSGVSRFHRLRANTARHVHDGPMISVIMPAFNAEATLELAASSILNQTWRQLELIIVDDDSQDETWAIAQRLAASDRRLTVLRNAANVGPYVSKNIALRVARGEYITGHDADDWAHPERIESHVSAVRAGGPSVRASLAGMLRMTLDGKLTRFAPRGPNTNDGALVAGFISCLFEARFLKEVLGGWDEVRFGGDSELIQRSERVLGAPLPRFAHLGMICLDSPDGLTNHPEFGYSPLLGMSMTRKEYRDSFKMWHDGLTAAESYLPFPQLKRCFELPHAMAVDPRALAATLASYEQNAGELTIIRPNEVCDVCIVTDLRLPGGNASSTLEEIRYLRETGSRVLVVHCPTPRTQGKPISARYEEFKDICEFFYNVSSIEADVLIVRHPAVASSPKFESLAPRIRARATAVVVNNSIKRTNGDKVYSHELLLQQVAAVQCERIQIYPLGPAIRRELQALGSNMVERLADEDWTPTFDSTALGFKPKAAMTAPFVIGRHARDGVEKWPEDRNRLLAAYPESSDFSICVLGGADAALSIIGYKPSNWEILPFGSVEPAAYLSRLDAFVYFPHSGLNEAFGRAIMEAIFAGVPCVLPRAFRTTFEDMVFYSEPEDVAGVVRRLSRYPEWRLDFLNHARERARRYDSNALGKRLAQLGAREGTSTEVPRATQALTGTVREYKAWVETGHWVTRPEPTLGSGH
jgi:FkbM family methyltransferase